MTILRDFLICAASRRRKQIPAGTLSSVRASLPSQNPLAVATEIRFALPQCARVRVDIHDVCGRLLRNLLNGSLGSGAHAVIWDGRDAAGRPAGAGSYFARISASAGAAGPPASAWPADPHLESGTPGIHHDQQS